MCHVFGLLVYFRKVISTTLWYLCHSQTLRFIDKMIVVSLRLPVSITSISTGSAEASFYLLSLNMYIHRVYAIPSFNLSSSTLQVLVAWRFPPGSSIVHALEYVKSINNFLPTVSVKVNKIKVTI